jgi:hypothetical protein
MQFDLFAIKSYARVEMGEFSAVFPIWAFIRNSQVFLHFVKLFYRVRSMMMA